MFSTNFEYFREFYIMKKITRFSPWKFGEYTRWARSWDQFSGLSDIPWKLPFMQWNQQMADYYTHDCIAHLILLDLTKVSNAIAQ